MQLKSFSSRAHVRGTENWVPERNDCYENINKSRFGQKMAKQIHTEYGSILDIHSPQNKTLPVCIT